MTVESPEQLWVALGVSFFKKQGQKIIEYNAGKNTRRFFSFNNVWTVTDWPKNWSNPLLYQVVGYSPNLAKMTTIRNTYFDPERWEILKQYLDDYGVHTKKSQIKHFGMPFKTKTVGKGGCLVSFHVIQADDVIRINVQMKIAEVPRKFVADLHFVGELIRDLNLPHKSYVVTFMLSSMYFTTIALRSYIPIIGTDYMDFKGIDIEQRINYQQSVQDSIYKAREILVKRFGSKILTKGIGSEPYKALIEEGRI